MRRQLSLNLHGGDTENSGEFRIVRSRLSRFRVQPSPQQDLCPHSRELRCGRSFVSSRLHGKGAILKSQAENDVAATLTRYYHTIAWIATEAFTSSYCEKTGRYYFDPATCAAACSGAACTAAIDLAAYNSVQPERFFWRNGDPLTYRNFAAGEPDNAATADDIQSGFTPKGEHWVEMGTDGIWSDSGKHLADQVHSRPLIVEFAGALECVNGETGSGGSG